MARLILKCPYLKCDGNHSVSGYLRYIGTRERVELLPDDRPPTRKQEQLVRKLVKDFPSSKGLEEYSDYEFKPTKAHASAFITRALEENWPAVQQSDGYMKYIATRPRAERLGNHGLFSDEDGVDLAKAIDELDHYTGNVWTHIISLKREDAARLGYDNARAWQNLLRANRNDIAAAMNISPGNFRWYAAYPLVETGCSEWEPLCRLPAGQGVSDRRGGDQRYRQSCGVVQPVGRGGRPVRPVYAG